MFNYMYQYRCEVERIVKNLDRGQAWLHTKRLYDSGFIDLVEWNTLSEYSKIYRESYEKAGLK